MYSVDRIIDDIVVIENLNTKEISEENISLFDCDVVDGMVVSLIDRRYIANIGEEEKRRLIIKEKMDRLKRLKSNKDE